MSSFYCFSFLRLFEAKETRGDAVAHNSRIFILCFGHKGRSEQKWVETTFP
jgi:hypothetical protein